MLPETTLLEALAAIKQVVEKAPDIRIELLQNIIRYFFLNDDVMLLDISDSIESISAGFHQ